MWSSLSFAGRGLVTGLLATLAVRMAGIGTQILVARALRPEELAQYALAIGSLGMVSGLRGAGAGRHIVQVGTLSAGDYQRLWTRAVVSSTVIAMVGLGLGALTHGRTIVSTVCLVLLAVNLIQATPVDLWRSLLMRRRAFSRVNLLLLASGLTRFMAIALGLTLGWGVIVLAAVPIFTSCVELLLVRWLVHDNAGFAEPLAGGVVKSASASWRDLGWISFGSWLTSALSSGDYFILGVVGSPVLGLYYFGFTMASSVNSVFVGPLRSVLFPSFARASSADVRRSMVLRANAAIIGVWVPLCLAFVLMVPFVVRLLWSEEWVESTIVMQIVIISLPVRVAGQVGISLMEGCGLWRRRALIGTIELVLMALVVAWIGSSDRSVAVVVTGVVLVRTVAAGVYLVEGWYGARLERISTVLADLVELAALMVGGAAGLGLAAGAGSMGWFASISGGGALVAIVSLAIAGLEGRRPAEERLLARLKLCMPRPRLKAVLKV